VSRDIHNAIIPVDFSDPKQVTLVVETVTDFVKRKIPIRFGLVPITQTEQAMQQAKVLYHLLDTYGISALIQYLEHVSNLIRILRACTDLVVVIIQEDRSCPRANFPERHRQAQGQSRPRGLRSAANLHIRRSLQSD
jgi:hypothetical protein